MEFRSLLVSMKLLDTLFILFLETIMQKGLTPQHPSYNNCFVGDAVDDADETGTPLSSVSIGGLLFCNLRFADDIDPLGVGEEELQQHPESLVWRMGGQYQGMDWPDDVVIAARRG